MKHTKIKDFWCAENPVDFPAKMVSLTVLFFLLTSLLVSAQEDTSSDSCSGFFGSISCFLWGNPENRAGKGWFDRGAVVGDKEK